jgi:hypothetical protein
MVRYEYDGQINMALSHCRTLASAVVKGSMKLNILTVLSAIAFSLQSEYVWHDITSDVRKANDSINQGAAWQSSAQRFVNVFNHFRSSLEDAYRNCGGIVGL